LVPVLHGQAYPSTAVALRHVIVFKGLYN
jgi:hypothetical protein